MTTAKKLTGFAAMSPERRREVAAMGGKTAHLYGVAHVYTSDDASVYGKKGAVTRWHGKARARRVVVSEK